MSLLGAVKPSEKRIDRNSVQIQMGGGEVLHIVYNSHSKSHILFVPIFCWSFIENLQLPGDISTGKLLEVVRKGEGMKEGGENFDWCEGIKKASTKLEF